MSVNSNPVATHITQYGADDSTVFVFPSDIAASLWLEEALELTGEGTLPSDRFIAWDRFKEQAVQASVAGRRPVSAVIRKLYALELAERNSVAQECLFSALIPPDFAAEGSVFAAWISRLLPQLEVWEQKTGKRGDYRRDAEDADLSFLKADYRRFLDNFLLFEPSWQRPPLTDTGKRYFIFFHEAIEDFGEYAVLLRNAPFITLVDVPMDAHSGAPTVAVYENTREEIRAVALEIEELLRAGTRPEDIALSVPDLETVAPYLIREFTIRGIPLEYRSGETLGTRPAGRLFALIQNCVSSNFSFASLKALLLDRLIPWKHRALAEELVSFGIRNHCVTSWEENGRLLDVWEEAFKAPSKGEAGDWRLRDWYRELKNNLTRLTGGRTFSDIRNRYFSFRESLLDSALYGPEDDAVVARCIEELTALSALESRYAAYIPSSPYSFFVAVLDEKNYVPQRAHGGVSVFPYRVAAGTPFPHHFVLDASQDNATVLYRQLPFLRQDKRLSLNLMEDDASAAFFSMYRCTPRDIGPRTVNASLSAGARFTFASRSFSGYRTPHGYFQNQLAGAGANSRETGPGSSPDPFLAEREWRSNPAMPFPDRLYPAQKDGWLAWKSRDVPRGFSYLYTPFGNRLADLSQLVLKKQFDGADIRVTQKDLNTFSVCNARWFLDRILRIKATVSDAELLNERNLGLLYHDVLKKVYEKIRDTDRLFTAAHLADYRAWAEEFSGTAAADHAEFNGPLAAPIIASLVRKISDGVGGMLSRDAELLDGFIPEFLEDDIAFSHGGVRYYGQIDRISRRPSDNVSVLIDYKSGKPPATSAYQSGETTRITDFQIPMYVFLAEESPDSPWHGSRIEHAWFGSIREGDYRPIINDNEEIKIGAKRGMVTRDEFAPAMESFAEMTTLFTGAVRSADFTRPPELPWATCVSCDYQKICRYTYAVRP